MSRTSLGLKLGVGRRLVADDAIVVEWTIDYGDDRLHRNVSIVELRDGTAVSVTDYEEFGASNPLASRWRSSASIGLSTLGDDAAARELAAEDGRPQRDADTGD